MAELQRLQNFRVRAQENWSKLTLAGKLKRISQCWFVLHYWFDVKLVHWVTGGKRIILFFLLCLFAVISPERDGILDPIQIFLCFFMFFILGVAIANFIFAKISATRHWIDHYLDDRFIPDHGVNMLPQQAARVGLAVGAVIALKHCDDVLANHVNANALVVHSEAMKKAGMTLTPEMAKEVLGRPSMSQQCVKTGLEVLKEMAKAKK